MSRSAKIEPGDSLLTELFKTHGAGGTGDCGRALSPLEMAFGYVFASIQLVLLLIVPVAAGLALLWMGVEEARAAQARSRWHHVEGVVRESAIVPRKVERLSEGQPIPVTVWRLRLQYEYTVRGRTHRGERVAPGAPPTFESAQKAQAALQAYPKGKTVRVYYRADNPGESALHRGPAESPFLALLMGFALLAVGFMLWTVLVFRRLLRRRWESRMLALGRRG